MTYVGLLVADDLPSFSVSESKVSGQKTSRLSERIFLEFHNILQHAQFLCTWASLY